MLAKANCRWRLPASSFCARSSSPTVCHRRRPSWDGHRPGPCLCSASGAGPHRRRTRTARRRAFRGDREAAGDIGGTVNLRSCPASGRVSTRRLVDRRALVGSCAFLDAPITQGGTSVQPPMSSVASASASGSDGDGTQGYPRLPRSNRCRRQPIAARGGDRARASGASLRGLCRAARNPRGTAFRWRRHTDRCGVAAPRQYRRRGCPAPARRGPPAPNSPRSSSNASATRSSRTRSRAIGTCSARATATLWSRC